MPAQRLRDPHRRPDAGTEAARAGRTRTRASRDVIALLLASIALSAMVLWALY